MGDAENTLPPSKKRAAGRQLSRDNPGLDDDEDSFEQETGTFKKASDEVLASRRILKVRRQQTSSASSAPSNPFAGIRLVPPTNVSATSAEVTSASESRKSVSEEVEDKDGVNKEIGKGKDENDKIPESKVDEAGAESTANKDGVNKEIGKGKDENDNIPESKVNEAGAESTANKDKIEPEMEKDQVDEGGTESTADKEINDPVSEAIKPESADVKTAEGGKTENEVQPDSDDKRNENQERKDCDDLNVQKDGESSPFSSFQQLSSNQNAFTGLAGSGFSSSTFSFGPISKDGSPLGSGLFSFDGLKNGNSSFSSSPEASIANKSEGSRVPLMQEVTVETGEENEKAVFTADSVLFEFLDGGWKERGKGEVKVNISTVGTGKARLVMRVRGNYRLILNASLFSDMKLTVLEKKGITFACMNSTGEGKGGLSTFALKFKDASIVEEFCAIVTEHKGKTATGLKTPENSP